MSKVHVLHKMSLERFTVREDYLTADFYDIIQCLRTFRVGGIFYGTRK